MATATITGSFSGTGVSGNFADNTTTVEITEGLPAVATNQITAASYAITADENTLVTVQLKDALSNLITHERGVVTLSVTPIGVIDNGTSTGASAITANYAVANNGTYTATFKLNAFGVGNATITGKLDGSVNYTDNAIINVTHGTATKLVMATQPATTTYIAGVSFNPQPVIHINDQWDNIATSDVASVVTAARGTTGTSTLLGTLTATASAGVVTFSDLNYQLAESINIAFTSGSLTPATSNTFTVVHNVPSYMKITGSPTQTAGVAQTITIKAYDTYNNLADRFTGTKSLTFSGANLSPAPPYYPVVDGVHFGTVTPVGFSSGVATASMTLYKEETVDIASNHTDAAYTDVITGASALNINAAYVSASIDNRLHVVVAQAVPAYFAVTGSSAQVAGVAQTITITAYDDFNNPATNYSGTKTLKFAGANVSLAPSTSPTVGGLVMGNNTDLTFTNGVATASMVLYKVETATIVAADQAADGITTRAGYERSVVVSHAPASYYAVTGTATITAGDAQTVTARAYDEFNNLATSYTGDVDIVFTGANPSPVPSTLPTVTNKSSVETNFQSATTVTFAGGVATGSMKLYLVEEAIIVATTGAITTRAISGYDYRLHVTVNHAANAYFAVTGSNTDQTAGTSRDISVTMYDPYNNIATGYDGSKSITFTGAVASPNTPNTAFSPTVNGTVFGSATALTFTNGAVTTVPMILYNVETARIVATDGSLTTPSARNAIDYRLTIVVIHATEDFMTISGTGTQTAGTAQNITVRAYDHYNNLATRYDGAKSLTFSGASDSPAYTPTPSTSPVIGATVFGSATSLTFTAGVVTASMNLYKVETAHITATNSVITAGSHMLDVAVSHAAPGYLAITGTATQTAGTSQTITVTAYDPYNNLATGYTGSKSLTFSGADVAATSPVTHPTLGGTNFGTAKSLTFALGVATGSMTLYKTETALISATDGTIEANSTPTKDHRLSVLVGPTLLKDFIVYGVGTPVNGHTEHCYGDRQSVTVEPRDTYNNRKTNYNRSISFSVTDPGAAKPSEYTFTSGIGSGFDNGVHTFTNSVQFSKPSIPYSPGELGWWVTAVSILEPGKYGYQSDIWVLDRPITITANDATKDYYGDVYDMGTSAFTVTSTLSPVMPYQTGSVTVSEEVTSVGLTSLGTPATALAGDYPVATATATGINGFNPDYYNITYATAGTLTVNKRPITISVSPATQTKIYGATDPGALAYAITSSAPYDALVNGDVFTGDLIRVAGENVGTYAISQNSLSIYNNGTSTNKYANYAVTFSGGSFEITRKAIAIAVTAGQKKIYGETDPTLAFTTVPPIADLPFPTKAWTGALLRASGEVVVSANYAISKGTLELTDANSATSLATNYTVTFNPDNFEIQRKAITITVAPVAKTYGDSDPAFTYTSSPVVGSLPYSASFIGSLVRLNTNENVNTYTITQGSLELGDANNATTSLLQNYDLTFLNTNVLTINKRNITVAVNSSPQQSKVYAEADPVFAYTSSISLYYNGIFTGELSRAAGENVATTYAVGRHTLNIHDDNNATTSLDANYNLTFTPANFAITKKPITITINSGQQKVYGNTDPDFTFVSSVTPLPFSGSFIGALTRASGKDVGTSYTISRGTLNINDANNATTSLDANYDFNFAEANFAITTRPITITANTRTKTYGDLLVLGNTQFGISGDGMAYSETMSTVELTSLGTPILAHAGDYSITTATAVGTGSGYLVTNYNITYSSLGILTVNTRPLTLANFAAANKPYDGNSTVIGTGFDDNRMPGDVLAFTYDANFADQHAGAGKQVTYSVVAIVGGSDQFNYHLLNGATYTNAVTADITQKPLTLTAGNIAKTCGFAYTFAGTEFTAGTMVGSESIASVTLVSDGAASGAACGTTYPITPSDPAAGGSTTLTDYLVTLVNGTMTVGSGGNTNLSGSVLYHPYSGADEPLQGMTVTIRNSTGDVLYSAVTNGAGLYQFNNVPLATARLGVSTARSWGGVNATDALAIQLRSVDTPPAYWDPALFMDYVGKVKSTGDIDAQDVLLVKARVLHPADPAYRFTAGNWAFYANSTVLANSDTNSAYLDNPTVSANVFPTIMARPFGDIYGDYNPASLKSVTPIQTDPVIYVKAGELFDLPVRVKQNIDFSALTLILQFDASKVQVEGLTSTIPGLQFVVENNIIRAVWSRIEPVHYNADQSIVSLQMRTLVSLNKDDQVLSQNSQTQFGDSNADVIPDVTLAAPAIDNGSLGIGKPGEMNVTFTAYPNPFTEKIKMRFALPVQADVKIQLVSLTGVTVVEVVNNQYPAGINTFEYVPAYNELVNGTYFIKVSVTGKNASFITVQKLVYIK